MEQAKITIVFIIAILLQWTLRNVAEPFAFIDFPLIIVVYAALQRNAIRAIIFSTIAGLAVDALSGGLLGANGFSKTLIAYIVSEIVRRVYLDNLLLQIPVIAGACLVDNLVFYGMHRLLGQEPVAPLVTTIAYSVIGTTIAGTIIYLILNNLSLEGVLNRRSGGGRRREIFSARRQTRRRNPIRLGKRT
jgi:rod shape-determining protein MreD